MKLRLVFLVTAALNAVASFGAHHAHADSTPHTCDREDVHACSGAEEKAPCDAGAGPTVPGKCVSQPCMPGPEPDGTPVGRIDVLTCVPVNTCELLTAHPDHGGPCVGKAVGSTCASTTWLPDGGKCVVSSSCEELAPELGVYVAGRYVTCGRDREAAASSEPASSDGCSAAASMPSTSALVALVLGAVVVGVSRRRRSDRTGGESIGSP